MSLLRPRSLQLRLAARLGALFFVATVLAVGTFSYLSNRTADSLSRRDLFRLADELAEALGEERFPEALARLVDRGLLTAETVYAIRDDDGRVIAASNQAIREVAAGRADSAGRRADFLRLESFGSPPQTYSGLDIRERSRLGAVSVLVAEPDNAEDELLSALLRETGQQALWIIPLFVAVTLLVGIYAIRGGLRPLRETAMQAASIKPEAMSVRLSTRQLPSEVSPFVDAVNGALDRLEDGFALQRQFTANAAHELRTPLAILTAALDDIDADGKLANLRQDVARMNRLVDQLLHVARLDSVALDVSSAVDLRACARHVVEYMAPLAIEQGRELALTGVEGSVMIRGNEHAVEDALRNLVENALSHTPQNSEVLVEIFDGGSVRVSDRGPGVSADDREHVFDRFWRGPNGVGSGAGLGLAIVREIMKMHGGSVEVDDNPQGGARFTLKFPPASS